MPHTPFHRTNQGGGIKERFSNLFKKSQISGIIGGAKELPSFFQEDVAPLFKGGLFGQKTTPQRPPVQPTQTGGAFAGSPAFAQAQEQTVQANRPPTNLTQAATQQPVRQPAPALAAPTAPQGTSAAIQGVTTSPPNEQFFKVPTGSTNQETGEQIFDIFEQGTGRKIELEEFTAKALNIALIQPGERPGDAAPSEFLPVAPPTTEAAAPARPFGFGGGAAPEAAEPTLTSQLAKIQQERERLRGEIAGRLTPTERESELEKRLVDLDIEEQRAVFGEEAVGGRQLGAVQGRQAKIQQAATLDRLALSGELGVLQNRRIGELDALQVQLGFTDDDIEIFNSVANEEERVEAQARDLEVANLLADAEGETILDRYGSLLLDGSIGVADVPTSVLNDVLLSQGQSDIANTTIQSVDGRRVLFQLDKDGNVLGKIDLGGVKDTSASVAPVVTGSITPADLTPLAKVIFNGTAKLTDLTPTERGKILPELDAVGWTSAITAEMKQEVGIIKTQMDIIMEKWQAIPNRFKGQIQGRIAKLTRADERDPNLQAFKASANVVGMILTRMFEKGRISDQDRIFYLSLMPNITQNEIAAQAGADELKRVLDARITSTLKEINTGEVVPQPGDIDYINSLGL